MPFQENTRRTQEDALAFLLYKNLFSYHSENKCGYIGEKDVTTYNRFF
jgi:hypothetical protein